MKRILLVVVTFIILINPLYPQSGINPDISLVGTFSTFTSLIKETPEYGKLNFESPGMELFINGYLNPFSKASASISYEDDEFHLEEIYGDIVRGLPLDVQVKAGKYLVGFGKINTVHPHGWAFTERPLYHQVFFSHEGFNDIGVNINFLLPTGDIYSNLEIGIYKGESIEGLSDTISADRGISPLLAGRLSSFYNLSDYSNLEIGLNGAYSVASKIINDNFSETPLYSFYSALDLKYKYSPDAYKAITIQGELFLNKSDVSRYNIADPGINSLTNYGGFIFADYRFAKMFSTGLKYDYTAGIIDDGPTLTTLRFDDKNNTQGIEGWFSYLPVEETVILRLGVQHLLFHCADNSIRDGETKIKLQFIFSLGPHKAHKF
jgi:hypothetical protein